MKCVGNFKFKQIEKKDGGKFINANGQEIKYKESYALKVDEITDNGIDERIFKIPVEKTALVNQFKQVKPYTDLQIEFDVKISSSRISVIPTAIK